MGKLREQLVAAQLTREAYEQRQLVIAQSPDRADQEASLTYLLSGIAVFYFVVRFGATQTLDALNPYASYIFELSLVGLTFALLRPRLSLRALLKPLTVMSTLTALAAGFGALKLARLTNIAVPMDAHNTETVLFLLAIAPVLEEFLFRFMIFQPLQRIWNTKVAIIVSSIIFSYSHLHAIWFVPAEYDRFILYQTLYTLPLAFGCAFVLSRQRSLLSSVAVHAAFNLGFFLAFWL